MVIAIFQTGKTETDFLSLIDEIICSHPSLLFSAIKSFCKASLLMIIRINHLLEIPRFIINGNTDVAPERLTSVDEGIHLDSYRL